jgi:hypothetical protein
MQNVVCLYHRNYDGSTPPDLSCRSCCSKYIAYIKANLTKKAEEAKRAAQAAE